MPPLISSIVGHATGLLTMKQKSNGTILIGGGWQGQGVPQDGRGNVTANANPKFVPCTTCVTRAFKCARDT